MKISVVVPVYNEEATIAAIHERIVNTQIPDEIIYVDDGSTDKTSSILASLSSENNIHIITLQNNLGKGKALTTGVNNSSGDIVILQDADLEYAPEEYANLLNPFSKNHVDVVFGARFTKGSRHAFYLPHYVANRVLTAITNLLYGCKLNDMETGYKVFRRDIFDGLRIQAKRFEFEPEFTAKVLLKGYMINEVPISFNPRNYRQGKKIKFRDALTAIWILVKYRFTRDPFAE